MVRDALEHKRHTAARTILLLDAEYVGGMVDEQLAAAYLAKHGDPADEFGFKDVWIIGPTNSSSVRLREGASGS
jgi:hypothetical protein